MAEQYTQSFAGTSRVLLQEGWYTREELQKIIDEMNHNGDVLRSSLQESDGPAA